MSKVLCQKEASDKEVLQLLHRNTRKYLLRNNCCRVSKNVRKNGGIVWISDLQWYIVVYIYTQWEKVG